MNAILSAINLFLYVYAVLLLSRLLISLVRIDPNDNPLIHFLYVVTEPVLEPLRSLLPQNGLIDMAPAVALVLIIALRMVMSILASGL